jgi:uncharacterized repeat protein (TIGR03803 family)
LPLASLVADARGNLYGTTSAGGAAACRCGTVFEATPSTSGLSERVLYSFAGGRDGASPLSDLAIDASGALYGTTYAGGASCNCGTVFKLTPQGSGYTEHVIYRFKGAGDGSFPKGGVVFGADGALYGTASMGAAEDRGTVFRLAPATPGYRETTVFAFGDGEGSHPLGDLLLQGGALLGVTLGGSGGASGAVYELTPSHPRYTERVLYNCVSLEDGAYPSAGLIAGPSGTFFGATLSGGFVSTSNNGEGVAYELRPGGSGYIQQVIQKFGFDGDGPVGLTIDGHGALYGTTSYGGQGDGGTQHCMYGCGTLFELIGTSFGYRLTTLHHFLGGTDGAAPQAGPILSDGVLYGTTSEGGVTSGGHCSNGSQPPGCGTIFAVKP